MRKVRVLAIVMAMGGLLAMGGCKKKEEAKKVDPATCATTSNATADACKACCKSAGMSGHQWGGGTTPTCKCL